jgi:glycine/D-amino acid oxidase-like deaminating enzyme
MIIAMVKSAQKQDYRQQSFWLDSVPDSLTPRPSLENDVEVDIAIVGAGYTGLWTAWYLKQLDPNLNIAMLETEIAGFGASGRNGGWCASFLSGIEHWFNHPDHCDGAIRLQGQMFDAVREVGRVTERESIDCHFEQSGALEVAVLPAQLKRLRAELEYMHGKGFSDEDYCWLSADETREMLNIDQSLGGLLMSHCAAIHPARLARGLAEAIEKQQVKIYEQTPALEIDGNQLRTPHGSVTANTIVLATEGYTNTLPGQQRRLIPLHSMMVVTEPLNDEQLEAIGATRRYTFSNLDHVVTYGQLTADKRIAFGARGSYNYGSRVHRFDPADTEFNIVRKTLLRFFPSLEGIRFTHAWGGAMGVSRSIRPSVNYNPATGLAWAGGYFGNGVGAANLAGRTVADLVLGHDTERVHTPWVNPPESQRKWEPEPLRWMGISARRHLMHMADHAEYRGSRFAPAINKTLDYLFP